MPCFHPLNAYIVTNLNTGSREVKFYEPRPSATTTFLPRKLPCGRCIGCRLERSRQWAVRCCHEAETHKQNCFITLTFSPEYLEQRENPWSLDVRDFQLFMKKFRYKYGKNIRFYHCGEYGEMCKNCDRSLFYCQCLKPEKTLGRPHYHAAIFGFDFPDKEIYKVTPSGNTLYTSKSLSELWPYGFSTIGDLTFESAAYVARYIMKKINGDMAEEHYVHHKTGEILKPEYTTMSRRPGIGRAWLDTYNSDVYPRDFVVINGKKCKPPRYYDNRLKTERPYTFDDIKYKREENAKKHLDNSTPERLNVREAVQAESLKLLTRNKEI